MRPIANRNEFMEKSVSTLNSMLDIVDNLPSLSLDSIDKENTALIIIDMINGFAREGLLKSHRVGDLIPEIARLSEEFDKHSIAKIAFADCHTNESPEFESYPPHCIADTSESSVVNELKDIGGYLLISKNSTNGFLEESFQNWLGRNDHINNFIVVGDCTDICVDQFSKSLKAYFNMKNKKVRVIVPVNAVDTYDLDVHNGDLLNIVSLYSMMVNGVEIVKEIK